MTGHRRWPGALVLAAVCALWTGQSRASVLYCDRNAELTPQQQDTLLRLGGLIRNELDASGAGVALISRSGTDLSRFEIRYSHAGIGVRAHPETPWSVRQLYFACDEKRPRIYDQGIAGFLLGTDEPSTGYVSVVLLPPQQAATVERAARDNRLALQLLGGRYSANAYAYETTYQNCNQWVIELLATAWGGLDTSSGDLRERAQAWLRAQDYRPSEINVAGWGGLGVFVPWLHTLDHPRADWERMVNRVSMPASIEAFVRDAVPGSQRIEFCHRDRQVVIHRGWTPVAEGCQPGEGDVVVSLTD